MKTKMFLTIILIIIATLVFLPSIPNGIAAVNSANPTIVRVDCNWIVAKWDDPILPIDVMFPGTAWLRAQWDGDLYYVALNTIQGPPNWIWAGYIGNFDPSKQWIVESGHIAVIHPNTSAIYFDNTPYYATCNRAYLPMIERGIFQ